MASIAATELAARAVEALLPAPVRSTGLALLAANLLPLYGVLAWDWPVYHLMALYWAENVVAGVFTLLRMVAANPLGGLVLGAFFCAHYGLFCYVHGVFVVTLFGPQGAHAAAPGSLLAVLASPEPLLAVLLMVLSHGWSFAAHALGGLRAGGAELNKIMMRPYGRMVVLHVTILAGGFLGAAAGAPELVLVPLILFKIVADLVLHRRANLPAESTEPPAIPPAVAPSSAPPPRQSRPFEIQ
jgi:hypothetical protein